MKIKLFRITSFFVVSIGFYWSSFAVNVAMPEHKMTVSELPAKETASPSHNFTNITEINQHFWDSVKRHFANLMINLGDEELRKRWEYIKKKNNVIIFFPMMGDLIDSFFLRFDNYRKKSSGVEFSKLFTIMRSLHFVAAAFFINFRNYASVLKGRSPFFETAVLDKLRDKAFYFMHYRRWLIAVGKQSEKQYCSMSHCSIAIENVTREGIETN